MDRSADQLGDLDASDAGLRIVLERLGRYGLGASVEEGLLLTRGPAGSAGSYAHAVLRLSGRPTAARTLSGARDHADRCGVPVVLWIRAHHDADLDSAARSAGLAPVGGARPLAGMIAREPLSFPPGREEGIVKPAHDARVFAEIVAAAYAQRGVTPEAARALLGNPRLLNAEHTRALEAVVDGEPVASALVCVEAPVAVLSWIGTIPTARRRGVATLITEAAMRTAVECGAGIIALQASAEGEPLYQQLGFQEVTRYGRYLVEPAVGGRRPRVGWG